MRYRLNRILIEIKKFPMATINFYDKFIGFFLKKPITIVTASDYTHGKSLLNLVSSISLHEPDAKLIIYDLGLTEEQVLKLRDKFNSAIIKKFDYEKYPSYFNITVNAGEYAWKPVIVEEVVRESSGFVIWMDAGNILYSKLFQVYGRILRSSFYSISSDGDMAKWTHQKTLEYFGHDKNWAKGKSNINGAFLAFDTSNLKIRKVVQEWAHYAQIKDVIAPDGSSRENHRQDQALLGVILHNKKMIRNRREFCGEFRIQRDVD